jgi:hypothetical protein
MSEFFRPIILNAFKEVEWPMLTRCAVEGIALADNLIPTHKILNWAVGRDLRGHLRRIGIMHSVYNACVTSALPYTCEIMPNTVGNCHHIQLMSQNVYAHVVHTSDLAEMPRETPLRTNARMSNQGNLFEGTLFTADLSKIQRWFAYLTFNADRDGNLTHLGLGIADKDGTEWLDIVSILKHPPEGYEIPTTEPPPLGPEELMRFQPHVQHLVDKAKKNVSEEKK